MASSLKRGAWVAAALLLGAANATMAGTVTATFNGANPGAQTFSINYLKPGNVAAFASVRAGQMDWTQTGNVGGGIVANGQTFSTYCIDLATGVNNNTFNLTSDPAAVPNPPTASSPTGTLTDASAGYAGKSKVSALSQLFSKHYNAGSSSGVFHAAFQIAIWEIIFETTAGNKTLAGGTTTISGSAGDAAAAVTMAQGWLNGLYNGPEYQLADFLFLTAPFTGQTAANQDQIYYNPPAGGPTPLPIPVPASVLGGGVLLAGLVTRRVTR